MNLYTVYDRLAKDYGPPFTSVNHDTAKRQALRMFRDIDGADFDLLHIGAFDTTTAVLTPIDPTFICNLASQIEKFIGKLHGGKNV